MASCLIDYSDYENAPGGLATFGGFFYDFQATLVATMACDYDFQKMAFDYDPLTRSGSPSPIIPGIPAPARYQNPAQICVAYPLGRCP